MVIQQSRSHGAWLNAPLGQGQGKAPTAEAMHHGRGHRGWPGAHEAKAMWEHRQARKHVAAAQGDLRRKDGLQEGETNTFDQILQTAKFNQSQTE